jgi:hypothetical protein
LVSLRRVLHNSLLWLRGDKYVQGKLRVHIIGLTYTLELIMRISSKCYRHVSIHKNHVSVRLDVFCQRYLDKVRFDWVPLRTHQSCSGDLRVQPVSCCLLECRLLALFYRELNHVRIIIHSLYLKVLNYSSSKLFYAVYALLNSLPCRFYNSYFVNYIFPYSAYINYYLSIILYTCYSCVH